MMAVDIKPARVGSRSRSDGIPAPRLTPQEWVRRRRETKEAKVADTIRSRVLGRLTKLGPGWHFLDGNRLGVGDRESFVAIGPGGVFAVTIRSQGRAHVRMSGDVIQIGGRRFTWLAEANKYAERVGETLSKSAGRQVSVISILVLAGTGLLTFYGLPRGAIVMPARDMASLLGSYGRRIAPRTVEKLASIARRRTIAADLRTRVAIPPQRSPAAAREADKADRSR